MGCSFSSKRMSKASKLENIRIVHLNGDSEEIEYPVTAGEVIGKPARHFLFTHTQLMAAASTSLKPDTYLERGHIYFLLPSSLFDANVSPMDLAPIARRMASMANKSRSGKRNLPARGGNSPVWSSPARGGNSPVWSSPARGGNSPAWSSPATTSFADDGEVLCGMGKSCKSKSWKPILDTIRERSFNLRNESDLMMEKLG